MKIFFDTEFQERKTRALDFISIGMVREDGQELYGVSHEIEFFKEAGVDWMLVEASAVSPWVNENVGKHILKEYPEYPLVSLHEITEFCDGSPEFWADWASYDWVTLCQLFGTMMDLPKGWPMFCHDLQQLLNGGVIYPDDCTEEGVTWKCQLAVKVPQQDPATLHHALHDARHLKAQYDFIQSRL